jgi:hypothetical protein
MRSRESVENSGLHEFLITLFKLCSLGQQSLRQFKKLLTISLRSFLAVPFQETASPIKSMLFKITY